MSLIFIILLSIFKWRIRKFEMKVIIYIIQPTQTTTIQDINLKLCGFEVILIKTFKCTCVYILPALAPLSLVIRNKLYLSQTSVVQSQLRHTGSLISSLKGICLGDNLEVSSLLRLTGPGHFYPVPWLPCTRIVYLGLAAVINKLIAKFAEHTSQAWRKPC
jgi:hypothetical protein